jgi:hypothetical protein
VYRVRITVSERTSPHANRSNPCRPRRHGSRLARPCRPRPSTRHAPEAFEIAVDASFQEAKGVNRGFDRAIGLRIEAQGDVGLACADGLNMTVQAGQAVGVGRRPWREHVDPRPGPPPARRRSRHPDLSDGHPHREPSPDGGSRPRCDGEPSDDDSGAPHRQPGRPSHRGPARARNPSADHQAAGRLRESVPRASSGRRVPPTRVTFHWGPTASPPMRQGRHTLTKKRIIRLFPEPGHQRAWTPRTPADEGRCSGQPGRQST